MAGQASRKPTRTVAWCATCGDASLPEQVDSWLNGRRFRCQRSSFDDFHAAAALDDRLLWWLRLQAAILRFCQSGRHPRSFVFGRRAEWYVPFLGVVLLMAYWLTPGRAMVLGVLLALWVVFDTLVFNSMVAFVTQNPRMPMRTMVFLLAAFLELAGAFGVLYRSLPVKSFDLPIQTDFDAFYFSVITFATVGYGDIRPVRDAGWAQALVVAQVAVGLYFLAGLFAIVASWASSLPIVPTLAELKRGTPRMPAAEQGVEADEAPRG